MTPAEVDFPSTGELRLRDVNPFIKFMSALLEEHDSKVERLPAVDPDGRSECPFAEGLYAEKEELTERVEKESKKIRPYLEIVDREVERCVANLGRINSDGNSLSLDVAREKYGQAKRAQEAEYEKAIQQRRALIGLMAWAAKAIAEARSKVFPGGKKTPHSFRPPFNVPEGRRMDSGNEGTGKPLIVQPSFKAEIDSLISLGPLKNKNFLM
jgi:hypothetical protein